MKSRIALLLTDLLFFSLSFSLSSYWFHIDLSPEKMAVLYLCSIGLKISLYIRAGLYHSLLRFAGLPLASTLLKTTAIASILIFMIFRVLSANVKIEFIVVDYLFSLFTAGIVRFAPRYFSEALRAKGPKRVLIYGAGSLGENVARKLLHSREYDIVGFIDDSTDKVGKRVHNLPIYGPFSQLNNIFAKLNVSEIIIAIGSASGKLLHDITLTCRKGGVFCRIVPKLSNLLQQEVNVKNIDISDLLKRDSRDLDEPEIRRFIKDKTILITGAGGSIGSELSRQCLRYGVGRLILIDHSELNLYNLQEELFHETTRVRFCLLNILNEPALEKVLNEEKPSIIFHAAAYKHVHIVEENFSEGLRNNILGTMITSQLASKYKVKNYILISTDKAVRPTSIMGASKRISELYIQNIGSSNQTIYGAVRFGNVLGSSGSVIPKFIRQINEGGPVTVTHPEVTRYFMLVSEAVQLILQAAGIGTGGEIFILNMGQPVRIAEMAEDLIFISGRRPHQDIQIKFTGLKCGEKLYEELLIEDSESHTKYENITIARTCRASQESLVQQINELLIAGENKDREQLLTVLKKMVPEFRPHTAALIETTKNNVSAKIKLVEKACYSI